MIPLRSLDELFSLSTPAAMARGNHNLEHGDRVPGKNWFRAEDDPKWPWTQGGGINAGVILLEPNETMFDMMRREVTTEVHPEHIAGSGPEQDYLSRFFAAAPWHHISVSYNFQPHHVLYALEYYLENRSRLGEWLPPRITMPLGEIRNVHFSGNVKLWDPYVLKASEETDAAFVERLLRSNCNSYSGWVDQSATTGVVDRALEQSREVVSKATRTWRECLSRMLVTLGNDDVVPPLAVQASSHIEESRRLKPERRQAANGNWYTREEFEAYYHDSKTWHTAPREIPPPNAMHSGGNTLDPPAAKVDESHWMFNVLAEPSRPPSSPWAIGEHLQVLWAEKWVPCTVRSVHRDGSYVVQYEDGGEWGHTERRVPSERLRERSANRHPDARCRLIGTFACMWEHILDAVDTSLH